MTDTRDRERGPGRREGSPGGARAKSGAEGSKSADRIRIQLIASLIGSSPRQRAVVAGLGLRRLNQVVVRIDTPEIRGMVGKVPHLVQIVSGQGE